MSFFNSHIESQPEATSRRKRRRILFFVLVFGLLLFLLVPTINTFQELELPPANFPTNEVLIIKEGLTIREIVNQLGEVSAVRSPLYLYIYLQRMYPDSFIRAGQYNFPEPLPVPQLADALVSGSYQTPSESITLPEGYSVRNLLTYLPERYQSESIEAYLSREGYLFPDTYFIRAEATLAEIITLLANTYEQRLAPLRPAIATSGFNESEIIIFASILEREANDDDSMRRVTGILKNRLAIDMPLQVDATFEYLFGKTSAELTIDDLKYDSPYNTYLYRGLPPAAIANPGLQTIRIAIETPPSDELYYLTGKDGKFYYAKTFPEHVRNKERYLR